MKSKKLMYLGMLVSACFLITIVSFVFEGAVNGWASVGQYLPGVVLLGIISILIWVGYANVNAKH